jgi:hypothetical protein
VVAVLAAVAAQSAGAAGPFDGQWKTSVSRAALLATGEVVPSELGQLSGPWTASFAGRRFRMRNERTRAEGTGTFVATGDRVRFVFRSGVAVRPGQAADCTFSIYRGRLAFAKVPGRSCLALDAATWTKAG